MCNEQQEAALDDGIRGKKKKKKRNYKSNERKRRRIGTRLRERQYDMG